VRVHGRGRSPYIVCRPEVRNDQARPVVPTVFFLSCRHIYSQFFFFFFNKLFFVVGLFLNNHLSLIMTSRKVSLAASWGNNTKTQHNNAAPRKNVHSSFAMTSVWRAHLLSSSSHPLFARLPQERRVILTHAMSSCSHTHRSHSHAQRSHSQTHTVGVILSHTHGSVQKRGQWENTENVTLQKSSYHHHDSLILEESRWALRVSRHTHMRGVVRVSTPERLRESFSHTDTTGVCPE
jgi:hypothetical protein